MGSAQPQKTYLAIDLKSFYASVECVSRGRDPLTTLLVVADPERTEKTICLAVSPALKSLGISGRARLFEVVEKVGQANAERAKKAPGGTIKGSSDSAPALAGDPSLGIGYIVAPPRLGYYMQISNQIYQIYLRYVAPEDIHVYSVDEVFIDVTAYLKLFGLSARDFALKLIREVLVETGITATAGIGTNLYLAKVAMDIVAKHIPADADGARIAELDEAAYRRQLWCHRPLTDFWRVGRGISTRLARYGIRTMGDIARISILHEDLLYRLFGVNAELLIDHAWGYEPCTIADIKAFRPASSSLSSGQVLSRPYPFEKGRLIVREMTDLLVLDLVEKKLMTDQMVLTVCYDTENLTDPARREAYRGPVITDRYGRKIPKDAHGSVNLGGYSSSGQRILEAVSGLYDRIVDPSLLVRRAYVVANHVLREEDVPAVAEPPWEQLDLFTDYEKREKEKREEEEALRRERSMQEAVLSIKERFGKNAILRGMNYEEGATTRERNRQVGGHRAWGEEETEHED